MGYLNTYTNMYPLKLEGNQTGKQSYSATLLQQTTLSKTLALV